MNGWMTDGNIISTGIHFPLPDRLSERERERETTHHSHRLVDGSELSGSMLLQPMQAHAPIVWSLMKTPFPLSVSHSLIPRTAEGCGAYSELDLNCFPGKIVLSLVRVYGSESPLVFLSLGTSL
jgi:hypothetical protein